MNRRTFVTVAAAIAAATVPGCGLVNSAIERTKCKLCDGSGTCYWCGGDGTWLFGECGTCEGTGLCPACSGTGWNISG